MRRHSYGLNYKVTNYPVNDEIFWGGRSLWHRIVNIKNSTVNRENSTVNIICVIRMAPFGAGALNLLRHG